jgi:hypothetical protein
MARLLPANACTEVQTMRKVIGLVPLFCLTVAFCGCRTVRESVPSRTATEQLLLSTATSNAVAGHRFPWLEGKKTYVEDKYFDAYDKGFAVSAIREQLSASGAFLVRSQQQADVVVELRSAALSMDNVDSLVGVPSMSLPIVLTGMPVQTPEVALYRAKRSDALAKFALFAYERESGNYLQSVNPMLGRANLRLYKIVFISWKKTNVPELLKHKQKEDEATERPPPS